MHLIDPLYSISGFAVGFLVGMTGVGGGSLMTPLLILLFGIHPATAVGTDLLYAAATKTGGSLVHGWARSIHWPVVGRLACGSLPASVLTLAILWRLNLNSEVARSVVNLVLCGALFLTAVALIFRHVIMNRYRRRFDRLSPASTSRITVALLLLYPQLPMARIIGSDIAHAVPLTLVAGAGHWIMGAVDWHLMTSLLVGSLPGIVIGSYSAIRVPETALRVVLATTLIVVATKLAIDEWNAPSSILTAHSRRAPQ
jgi:hypothetical protein